MDCPCRTFAQSGRKGKDEQVLLVADDEGGGVSILAPERREDGRFVAQRKQRPCASLLWRATSP